MREIVRTLWPYIRRYRRQMLLGIGALVVRNLAGASLPLVIKTGVDALTSGFNVRAAILLSTALIGLTLLKGLFQFFMRVIIIGISRDIEFDLRNDMFAHLLRQSSDFYARYRAGDIMARATNDLSAVRSILGPGIMHTADTMLTALLAVAIMLFVDWRLTLMALLPAPFVTLVVLYLGRYIHKRFTKIQALFSDISSRVQENVSGVRVVRAYVQEDSEQQLFEDLNRKYIAQNLLLARASGLFTPALQTLTSLSFLAILWYGGYRLIEGELSLGGFLMFNVFLGYLIWPMIAMGWIANQVQRGSASLSRINQMLGEEPTIDDSRNVGSLESPLRGEIEFCGVEVAHNGTRVLKGLTFGIKAGSTVAIVGHTGSGKSTLVELIPRLLDPTSGTVRIDGADVRDLPLRELRRQIGFVPQDTFLFSATLADNIAFGVQEATEEQIRYAAELAGLEEDVAGFPEGYQTMLGERGITLSGGQKQRTAIARAVLRDPQILILDDALSSVDTVTEERILSALSNYMKRRTTILISHRVSTVRNADRIFVIENGLVAEEGSHDELLALDRYYADLYQKQMLEDELETI